MIMQSGRFGVIKIYTVREHQGNLSPLTVQYNGLFVIFQIGSGPVTTQAATTKAGAVKRMPGATRR